jgi:photosystem II stability/assembly factor-like uncharacterized protein
MKNFLQLLIINYTFLIINCYAQQSGWEIIPSGTTNNLNSIFFYENEIGFAVGDFGTVIKSIDSGKTWQNIQTPITNNLNDLYVFNDSTVCVVGDSGTILFSLDAGNNWYVGPYFLTENYYSISFSGTMGIVGGSSQTIVQSEFSGTNVAFFEVQSGFFGGGFYGASMLSPQIGFVAGENSIFQPLFGKTTDSGINWDFTAFYLNNNEGKATGIDFTDINTGYVSASVWDGTGAIAKTTDGGNNWISTMFNYPLWSIDFPISNASLIGYAAGDQGTIIKLFDAAMNWQQQESGITLRLNKIYFLNLDFGFAVGENGIILRTTTGGEPVTSVEDEQSVSEYQLYQNYPNPFNPSTSIRFSIPVETDVLLSVFNILGQEVAEIVNSRLKEGYHEIDFDAANLTSGIYFYRLETDKFVDVKKMIIIK